ncbi:response regulator transcription factor [Arthrobacter sp. SDTb3-6]|uniref:response regulator transcription factor n=1 Tax=Arthrobacter sp. SDTb3-6 TaxID=2713571 RepID=UPI00159DAD06|nr:response regulator transcription factor [Arthrobacter sp. SDTb3-6]
MDGSRVAVIIEDDQDIRELIKVVLAQSGFEVHTAGTGAAGVEAVRSYRPAVVTLDLGLPDIDGFEAARRIRLFSDCYIIMLTARGDELDTLLGLETGADDYLTKPFRPRELRARVGALLRRPRQGAVAGQGTAAPVAGVGAAVGAGPAPSGTPAPSGASAPSGAPAGLGAGTPAPSAAVEHPPAQVGLLVHSGLCLNGAMRTAEVDGTELELTRTEFDLLLAVMEGGKRVLSKAELVRRLRGEGYDVGSYISDSDERTIEVHMANLRRKLGDDPRSPRWIKTVRGIGYRLAV